MEPLATMDELVARLDWTLDEDEERLAESALEDLSDDARFHGSTTWIDATVAPRQVKSIVLRATVRYLRNPDGYITSRAGDETLGWTDRGEDAGSASFSAKETKMLRQISGISTLHSVPLTAWGPMKATSDGFVPVDNTANEPFPLLLDDGEWL